MPTTCALLPSATVALLLAGLATCQAQPPAAFTPPGPNVALHKPYTMEPPPNYVDCADDGDKTQLTDGVYAEGYFWVQAETVGWVRTRLVAITIDLGQPEPIAGLSYSTAAGVADVIWPAEILVLVSDDREVWTVAGDLIELSNSRGAPPPAPYQLHRFTTGDLRTHGRYVALVVDCSPYTVVDEIEVYRGEDSWLSQPLQGKQTALPPLEYRTERGVLHSIQYRMKADLSEVLAGLEATELPEAEKAVLRQRAAALRAQVEDYESVPEGFTTILPLNELHERVYALNAPVLRAGGYNGLAVWGAYRYDPLQPLQAPAEAPSGPPALSVRMARNEHRGEVLNLTNATDGPVAATVQAEGAQVAVAALRLREVLFTDTQRRVPVASALGEGRPGTEGLQVTVPAGTTGQVWLDVDSRDLPAGEYELTIRVVSEAGPEAAVVPLSLHVADVLIPSDFSIAIGGWDETNNKGGYDVTAQNMLPLIARLREYGVNMPWSNPQVMPTPGQYDAEGNMTAPPDFSSWDEWVGRWRGAPHWGLFPSVRDNFAGEPMGTARFDKMVGAWVTAWVEHAKGQGIEPQQIKILLVDEPSREEQDKTIVAWAKAIHAAQPDIVIWNDPVHADPATALPEFYGESDVLSPNTTRFLGGGKDYRDFFVARQAEGCELWFYSCSGPSKLLDPASYYRGQFWLNIKYGGRGSCYWAFGDEAGNSWHAYVQPRSCYSPLFLSETAITDAKQMEAIREGAQDYELFALLRAGVEVLERRGVQYPLVDEARGLLESGPEQAVAIMGPQEQQWAVAKDRAVMDRVREQALELLEKLQRLIG